MLSGSPGSRPQDVALVGKTGAEEVEAEELEHFINEYAQGALYGGSEEQVKAFVQSALLCMAVGPAFSLCTANDLELLELELSCIYANGYHADHLVVKTFWRVVHGMSEIWRRKLLLFCTGCDRPTACRSDDDREAARSRGLRLSRSRRRGACRCGAMGDGEAKAWPLRCPKPLEAVQELLIQYLSSGQGYDDESVSLALQEGNQLFQQKDFSRACDFFGIAYEIGRHHYCYRPLLHDLLLRRALCHSLLGNFKVAQQEIEKALWLIPHEATGLLVAALVYSKLGLVTEANVSFQQAVCSQRELKDLVDCLVAFFCLQHHYADRAVNICTQVLQRSPKCPLALLMRGDAYRFGPASRARQQSAAADYADLLDRGSSITPWEELDFNYQALMCRQAPDPANHTRAEELLLSFHPTLQMQAPKPYHHYALYRHKDPLGVACMVVLAVTKLRLLSSSGKLIRRATRRRNVGGERVGDGMRWLD
eukprot:g32855.t1